MAKRLTIDNRGRIAEKIMEWGNLVFVGLVIAQAVPLSGQFRLSIAAIGVLVTITAYAVAIAIMKGGRF